MGLRMADDGSEQTGLGADGVESAVDRRLEGLTVKFKGDRDLSRVCIKRTQRYVSQHCQRRTEMHEMEREFVSANQLFTIN